MTWKHFGIDSFPKQVNETKESMENLAQKLHKPANKVWDHKPFVKLLIQQGNLRA